MHLFKFRKKYSVEWIQEAIVGIDELDPSKKNKSEPVKNDDSEFVAYSLDVDSYSDWEDKVDVKPTFQEMLFKHIANKMLSSSQFYKRAYIDRKLFSTMKNDRHYQPKKETAVACCFGLGLNLSEAEELLGLAGYSLSLAITWDRVIYYCLDKGISDIYTVNILLDELGEKCIRE